jgi:hypothetical protein
LAPLTKHASVWNILESTEHRTNCYVRKENAMVKLLLGSISAIALLALFACSDSNDKAATEGTTPPPAEQTEPAKPAETKPPATDQTTTQAIKPTPQTGTGGESQENKLDGN